MKQTVTHIEGLNKDHEQGLRDNAKEALFPGLQPFNIPMLQGKHKDSEEMTGLLKVAEIYLNSRLGKDESQTNLKDTMLKHIKASVKGHEIGHAQSSVILHAVEDIVDASIASYCANHGLLLSRQERRPSRG
jgi:hypothetical protein